MKQPNAWWRSALLAAIVTVTVTVSIALAPAPAGAVESDTAKTTTTQPEDVRPSPASPPSTSPGNSTSPKRETYPFRGKIASYDTASQALTLAGKSNRRIVQVTAQTRLMKEGQPAVADDLKTGEEVGGTLRKTADGGEEAVLIRIGPKPEKDRPATAGAKRSPTPTDPNP